MFKKILLSPWTALFTLALVLLVRVTDPTFVESVRLRYFDTLISSRAPTENTIVTVDIDEASLSKYGQWPFPRGTYAHIIEDLYARKAGLVVLNSVFAESDRFHQDSELAQMMKHYPVVIANVPGDKTKNNPRNPGSAVLGPEFLDQIITYPEIGRAHV